jgi:hypothetical protein
LERGGSGLAVGRWPDWIYRWKRKLGDKSIERGGVRRALEFFCQGPILPLATLKPM